MNILCLSGIRLVSWLNEDSTYPRLQSNIERTFPSTPNRQNSSITPTVRTIEYTPHTGSNMLEVNAQVSGNSQTTYNVKLMFNNVNFESTDSSSNVTFITSSGSEQSIDPININNSTVKVSCTCMDFRFRFATWNFADNSLVGAKPPLYVRKTQNRPPVNPTKTPGVCKHIIATVRNAQSQHIVV